MAVSADAALPASLQNLVDQPSLKWIFVGGKGGVGKTTNSCSLAIQLAKARPSVLLISTDPAHNLSDAFNQKFTKAPTKVNGFDNLSAMEIDPKVAVTLPEGLASQDSTGMASFLEEIMSSFPGIDEAMSFAEVIKLVQTEYSVIVFDTAPTGHTLRFLTFPSMLENLLKRLGDLRTRFGPMINSFAPMLGMPAGAQEAMMERFESLQTIVKQVNQEFADPEKTTFVCVCIAEFLSLYETERLVQELAKFNMDCHNIIVNQLIFPKSDTTCEYCATRFKMQKKYLDQIEELYEDFHVVKLPLLTKEVRGVDDLKTFSQMLINPYIPPQ